MLRAGWEQIVGRRNADLGLDSDDDLVNVISKSDYEIDGRVGSTQKITLAAGIDSTAWKRFRCVTRLHAKQFWSATATLKIIVQNISIVPERPDLIFVSSVDAGGSNGIDDSLTPPFLDVSTSSGGTPVGPMLRVLMRWEQGATAASAPQTFSLSVDLVGKRR